jgi:hypothetical protein
MIKIDFSLAVSLYLCIFLFLIICSWLLFKKYKDKDLSLDVKFIWYCTVCTYAYINTKEENFSVCPRCGSYNKKVLKTS